MLDSYRCLRDILPALLLNQGGLSGGRRGEEGIEGGEGAGGNGGKENLGAKKHRGFLAAKIKVSTLGGRKDRAR